MGRLIARRFSDDKFVLLGDICTRADVLSPGTSSSMDENGNVTIGDRDPDTVFQVKMWKGWLPTYRWTQEGGDIKQFSRESVAKLLAALPNAPSPLTEFSFCFGPAVDGDIAELVEKGRFSERVYAVYQAADGDYYLAKGNSTCDERPARVARIRHFSP